MSSRWTHNWMFGCIAAAVFLVALVGCSSQSPLTKEELALQRRYGRTLAEDKEYTIGGGKFTVRPVLEPFIDIYARRIGDDAIEFTTIDHLMDRDYKFFAGRLSTYIDGVNMFDSPDSASVHLRYLLEHARPGRRIAVVSDSSTLHQGYPTRTFAWRIVNGGSSPVTDTTIAHGGSRDAVMLGSVVVADGAAYLIYLRENDVPSHRRTGPGCAQMEQCTVAEAASSMNSRFIAFLNNFRVEPVFASVP
jgi:hypothetical protein